MSAAFKIRVTVNHTWYSQDTHTYDIEAASANEALAIARKRAYDERPDSFNVDHGESDIGDEEILEAPEQSEIQPRCDKTIDLFGE